MDDHLMDLVRQELEHRNRENWRSLVFLGRCVRCRKCWEDGKQLICDRCEREHNQQQDHDHRAPVKRNVIRRETEDCHA